MSKVYYYHLPKGLDCSCQRDGTCENWKFSKCVYRKLYPKEPVQIPSPPTTGSKASEPKYKIKTVFAPNISEEYKRGYFKGYTDGIKNLLKEILLKD